MPPNPQQPWQVDRHIPVALLLAMVIQTVGIVWWAATLTGRVAELEQKVATLQPASERLIRLETRFESVLEKLTEIKAAVTPSFQRPALTR